MKVTLSIIFITAIAFALQVLVSGFTEFFSLVPEVFYAGNYWQILTYMFMHSDVTHIGLNMFFLLIFGTAVEREIGRKKYAFLYFFSGIGSAVFYLVLSPGPGVLLLGASGAVFGAMAGYAILFPTNWLFIPPGIPVPALLAIFLIAVFELFSGFFGLAPGIANFGHFGGIIAGAILMGIFRLSGGRTGREKRFEYMFE